MDSRKSFSILFLCTFLLISCVSDKHDFETPSASFIPETYQWIQVSPEISYTDVSIPEFPLIYHLVRIDLSSQNLEIFDYCEKETESEKGGLISSIYTEFRPFVLTNTSPFNVSNPMALKFSWPSADYNTVGIHISDGKIKSEPAGQYCALAFFKDGESYKASVFNSQKDEKLLKADFAFGGFYAILRDYEVIDFKVRNYNSRTGAGVTQDGKTLYLLAVEGEKKNRSIGLPYPDCAEIFLALGCSDAMQFDGGGSTCLYVDGKNLLTYKAFRKCPAFMGFKLKK